MSAKTASTTFVPYLNEPSDLKHRLNTPILASFPQNLPMGLKDIKFTMYEHPSSAAQNASKKKRVIKARGKNISYTASSTALNASNKHQCLDYYVGVVSSKNDGQVYTMPVSTPFQFVQDIDGFQELYGNAGDNEAIKNMTYMEKKALLV